MLYDKNSTDTLSRDLFQNPSGEYRGAPFWAWNCRVTKEETDYILEDLKQMGMGGAHLHSRTGMDLPYLSEEFMEMVRYAHEKGKEMGMLTWLYDEDRFPSGAAGGYVTKNTDYRQRVLILSPKQLDTAKDVFGNPLKENQRKYLGKYRIRLKDGYLEEYSFEKCRGDGGQERLETEAGFDTDTWYLYREAMGDNPWFNNQAYVDTLNPAAMAEFIRVTHEAYFRELGEDFGKTIPAIFTDEPQFWHKETLGYPEEKRRLLFPFTDDFPRTYKEAYDCDFFESLPECVWELPGGAVSAKRYYYHDHLCKRFTEAFADRLGAWCKEHGIALTGHMMEEPTLASQTAMLGEAMRSYRAFALPGIDMLYDSRELNTAKQAQSAVRQYGREGMMSELYGVTGWDFDFRGHKLAGDWQAALGVTVRVPHLTWTSMAGEAKRDYPASIGYQSPWYREYKCLEDYFSRLNTALTRGVSEVKIGVLHPIESYWLYFGIEKQTRGIRKERDKHFKQLSEWLLYGLLDFDFIAESLWSSLTPLPKMQDAGFAVGKMQYDVIIVPDFVTVRRSSLERLQAFARQGGRVVFMGGVPDYVDALPCKEAKEFAKGCEQIAFTQSSLLKALKDFRTVEVTTKEGSRTDNLLYQLRQDKKEKWLFLAHCRKMQNPDLPKAEELTIEIKGIYRPQLFDAMTGEVSEIPYRHEQGKTIWERKVFDHDSLLYRLEETESAKKADDEPQATEVAQKKAPQKKAPQKEAPEEDGRRLLLPDWFSYSMEEPNVLVLDMAEYKLDMGEWRQKEEILRIDNELRKKLGYPKRTEAFPQPWIYGKEEEPEHRISLRFAIHSNRAISGCMLALENAKQTKLFLNGSEVEPRVTGYFTDRAIQKVSLPELQPGENELEAQMPYYHRFALEAMYLLGDFGVKLAGKNAILEEKPGKLAFGDICSQGLPFYGGNLTYRIPIYTEKAAGLRVEVTQFRCFLIGVSLDGKKADNIALSPYQATIPRVEPGEHMLELTVYGNRFNTFGALHNCNATEAWQGHPDTWRTEGATWAYEYQVRPQGILKTPCISLITAE